MYLAKMNKWTLASLTFVAGVFMGKWESIKLVGWATLIFLTILLLLRAFELDREKKLKKSKIT